MTTANIPSLPEAIPEMVRRIVAGFAPLRVVLFGSYARGEAGPDSDADLLVVLPFSGSKRRMRVKIGLALQGVGLAKDILVATPEEAAAAQIPGSVLHAACREGLVLYERASV